MFSCGYAWREVSEHLCGVQSGFPEKSSLPLQDINLRGSVGIIMGSEENGITSDLINLSDARAKIPMHGEIQSLNVSVATGIILYEKMRQENA